MGAQVMPEWKRLMASAVIKRAAAETRELVRHEHKGFPVNDLAFTGQQTAALKASAAYAALVSKADEIGWPAMYTTDLTQHDRALLVRLGEPVAFLWGVRERGTTLLPFTSIKDYYGQEGMAYDVRLQYQYHPEMRWFIWNGSNLAELTFGEARARAEEAE
jgi:hypothetical protein